MGAAMSVVAVAGPVFAGASIGMSIAGDVKGWYNTLKKSKLTPPDSAFGPVWTVLYIMMGISSVQAFRAGARGVPLVLYGAQLAANLAWSPLFFKAKDLTLAAADIAALLGLAAATAVSFDRVSPSAARLLVPYLGWTAYATLLTAKFWLDNPQARCGEARGRLQRRVRHALGGGRRADSPPPPSPAAGAGAGQGKGKGSSRPSSAAAAASAASAPASSAVGEGAAVVADEIDAAGRAARAKVASAKAA